ncbi:MAG: hypothetical protein Q8K78_13380, partial [Planctomycetaceae bacterium]|nr:hypothetical protein [Planctomycetaceae bacterium]
IHDDEVRPAAGRFRLSNGFSTARRQNAEDPARRNVFPLGGISRCILGEKTAAKVHAAIKPGVSNRVENIDHRYGGLYQWGLIAANIQSIPLAFIWRNGSTR